MRMRTRTGARLSAVVVAAAVPATLALVPHVPLLGADAARHPDAVRLMAQPVADRTTIVGPLDVTSAAARHRRIAISSAKGERVWTASSLGGHDVPSAAMRAYRHAARTVEGEDPGCHLPWSLLAGIGRVESDHGRYGGSVLGADGVPRPAIVGVALDGEGPVAAIHDTDDGRFDGDTVWDRAVGPMQFIPSTWRTAGRDGDGDGVRSPNDIDDAALAAAAYLCHGGRDLSTASGRRAAIFSYNPSDYYVDLVSAFARGYRTGSFVIPSPAVSADAGDGVVHLRAHDDSSAARTRADRSAADRSRAKRAAAARHARDARKARAAAAHRARSEDAASHEPAHRPAHRPTRTPSHHSHQPVHHPAPEPVHKPKPKPKPTPPPAPVLTVEGVVTALPDDAGWQVDTLRFDETALASLTGDRVGDWDGDGTVETAGEELTGLAGSPTGVHLDYTAAPVALTAVTLLP